MCRSGPIFWGGMRCNVVGTFIQHWPVEICSFFWTDSIHSYPPVRKTWKHRIFAHDIFTNEKLSSRRCWRSCWDFKNLLQFLIFESLATTESRFVFQPTKAAMVSVLVVWKSTSKSCFFPWKRDVAPPKQNLTTGFMVFSRVFSK